MTWLIAASSNNVSHCLPYWSHCHSISATGRHYPEYIVFKVLMLTAALAMLFYWWRLKGWLDNLLGVTGTNRLILWLGMISALALIQYTLTLGALGEPFALARRTGVVIFFTFCAFAHLLLNKLLAAVIKTPSEYKIDHDNYCVISSRQRQLLSLNLVLLVIGVASAILGFVWSDYQHWENAFEWWFALLMSGQFIIVGNLGSVRSLKVAGS